jgi:hypothetical protein
MAVKFGGGAGNRTRVQKGIYDQHHMRLPILILVSPGLKDSPRSKTSSIIKVAGPRTEAFAHSHVNCDFPGPRASDPWVIVAA